MTQRIVDKADASDPGDGCRKTPACAPLSVRPADPGDASFIARLAAEAAMGELSDRGCVYVAERAGESMGFIRLLEDSGTWYVNPVVVDAAHRREGIGEALMGFARDRVGELRFVARGYAVPFYEALGCETLPWEAIAPIVADDCDGCEMLPDCHPQPMRMP